MGNTKKSVYLGDGLDDDQWHTFKYERKEMLLELALDDRKPVIGNNRISFCTPICIYIYNTVHFK